jgi:hypothetical protein
MPDHDSPAGEDIFAIKIKELKGMVFKYINSTQTGHVAFKMAAIKNNIPAYF